MGSFDLPGHPLHFAGEMRPAYRTREPACLLASIAVIRLRSSWPGRIPRPLFLSGSGKIRRESPAHAWSQTSELRDLKPKVRATTPRAREAEGVNRSERPTSQGTAGGPPVQTQLLQRLLEPLAMVVLRRAAALPTAWISHVAAGPLAATWQRLGLRPPSLPHRRWLW
jgi:hypothetical protein